MALDVAFYADSNGTAPAVDFLLSLSEKERNKCFQYLAILSEFGNRLTSQYIKHIDGDLWEMRPEFGGVEMRLFYFLWQSDLVVVLHGFKKKSRKTPSLRDCPSPKKNGEPVMRDPASLPRMEAVLDQVFNDPEKRREYDEGLMALRFGVQVAFRCELLGLTTADVEARSGISPERLLQIQQGELPDTLTQMRLAKALNARIIVEPTGQWRLEAAEMLTQAA